VDNVPLDKRFVYYVLAATGICVVPISSFCSDLLGFRVTRSEERRPWMEFRRVLFRSVDNVPLDKRFVYYVLAATGICVVPISSFCSDLLGFRVTLLEEDPERMRWLYQRLKAAIEEYLGS